MQICSEKTDIINNIIKEVRNLEFDEPLLIQLLTKTLNWENEISVVDISYNEKNESLYLEYENKFDTTGAISLLNIETVEKGDVDLFEPKYRLTTNVGVILDLTFN